MKYLSVKEIADKWGVSERSVRSYCAAGRIPDAFLSGKTWNIPENARFADYKELLKSGLVDAVDITTSNDWHVPIALDALDAGLPVSVEKPIGMNFDESLALRKKSEETGLPVFVCFSWRYRDCPRYIRSLVQEGKIDEQRIHDSYIRIQKLKKSIQ